MVGASQGEGAAHNEGRVGAQDSGGVLVRQHLRVVVGRHVICRVPERHLGMHGCNKSVAGRAQPETRTIGTLQCWNACKQRPRQQRVELTTV